MHAGGAMTYLSVDSDGFPIDPKESTDVVSVVPVCYCICNVLMYCIAGFFEGENFHKFHEFLVIRENFTCEIFIHNSLSLCAIHS